MVCHNSDFRYLLDKVAVTDSYSFLGRETCGVDTKYTTRLAFSFERFYIYMSLFYPRIIIPPYFYVFHFFYEILLSFSLSALYYSWSL